MYIFKTCCDDSNLLSGCTNMLYKDSKNVLTGHLREDVVKVSLVLVVDKSIVKDALTLVTEQTEDLHLISHCSRLTLQHTCTHTYRKQKKHSYTVYIHIDAPPFVNNQFVLMLNHRCKQFNIYSLMHSDRLTCL